MDGEDVHETRLKGRGHAVELPDISYRRVEFLAQVLQVAKLTTICYDANFKWLWPSSTFCKNAIAMRVLLHGGPRSTVGRLHDWVDIQHNRHSCPTRNPHRRTILYGTQ